MGDGLPPFRASLREPRVHARAHGRDLLDVLRRQVPRPRASGGPTACARRRRTRARRSSAQPSARSPAGSGSTGSSRTRRRGTSRCVRVAGPDGSGRRRSAPSTSPAARRRQCSTRPRSRRSRSPAATRAEFLERMCANRVARDVGAITYTQMLNPRGGVECDFTVTRLAEDRFRIVTGTAFGRHDLAWMRMHAPDTVQVEDVTSKYACLGLWGPAAREILQPLTTEELSLSRTCARASSPSARCPASPCASPTSASSAGSSTARWSSASASGTRSGRPVASTGSSPAATRRSTRCGSRRATASGAPT